MGRGAFLRWSALKPVPVVDSARKLRSAVIVAPLRRERLSQGISDFMRRVDGFKRAAREGRLPSDAQAHEDQQSYEAYVREFSGLKRGQ